MRGLLESWRACLKSVALHPLMSVMAAFSGGIILWGGMNWSLEITNTETFCVSCHVMREYVFKEYKKTGHYTNRTGVRASCPDCHVPREWRHKVKRKVLATNEFFHWMLGSIDTPKKFKAKRGEMARRVWVSMKETDSRECRNCHGMDSMAHQEQTMSASTMHVLAGKWDKTCIDCHQGIAHALPDDFDVNVQMDELHDRMEKEEVGCQLCHEDMTQAPRGEGW